MLRLPERHSVVHVESLTRQIHIYMIELYSNSICCNSVCVLPLVVMACCVQSVIVVELVAPCELHAIL